MSRILGYRAGGLNSDGTPKTTSHILQAGLSVSGQGSAQVSRIFVMTSTVLNDGVFGYTQAGGFTAHGPPQREPEREARRRRRVVAVRMR